MVERVVRVDGMFERGVDDAFEPRLDLVDERLVRRVVPLAGVAETRAELLDRIAFLPRRELVVVAHSGWGRRSWCVRPCGR